MLALAKPFHMAIKKVAWNEKSLWIERIPKLRDTVAVGAGSLHSGYAFSFYCRILPCVSKGYGLFLNFVLSFSALIMPLTSSSLCFIEEEKKRERGQTFYKGDCEPLLNVGLGAKA